MDGKPKSTGQDASKPRLLRRAGLWFVLALVLPLAALIAFYMKPGEPRPTVRQEEPEIQTVKVAATTRPSRPVVTDAVARVDLQLGRRPRTDVEQMVEKFDPSEDDWDSEVLSAGVTNQLNQLGKAIADPRVLDIEHIEPLLGKDFSGTRLRSPDDGKWVEVFNDETIRVRRLLPAEPARIVHRGAAGFMAAIREMAKPFPVGTGIRVKFKLVLIDPGESPVTTRVLYSAYGSGAEHGIEQNATWRCTWLLPDRATEQEPRLASIELEELEEVTVKVHDGRLFSDCTESVLGRNASYRYQILPGIDHWVTRFNQLQVPIMGHQGLAVGDVNGDGLDDLYVCAPGGMPNRLYVQDTDGTAMDVSAKSGVDWLNYSSSALLIDLDNDGDSDLVVVTPYELLLAENDGQGRFSLRNGYKSMDGWSAVSAADYDLDHDLDLYLCGYVMRLGSSTLPMPIPYQDAQNGAPNRLLRNEGDFQFSDATEITGLHANNNRFSFSSAWEDFDDDGDLDIYVANDFGRNNLYRNDNGRFTDIASQAGVEDVAAGMSVSWGDCNLDGRMDIYVSNMFSAAGNRITYQRRFAGDVAAGVTETVQRMARGNTLFLNAGDGTFTDISQQASVTMGRWAWASKFVDFNNDTRSDLVVANGYITSEDTGDL